MSLSELLTKIRNARLKIENKYQIYYRVTKTKIKIIK